MNITRHSTCAVTAKFPTIVFSFLIILLNSHAFAELINFDSAGLSGPSIFAQAGPAENISISTSIGDVLFSGGVLLTRETNMLDQTTLYGTTNLPGFGPPKENPLTITFPMPVSNFVIDVLNGLNFTRSYRVSDNAGHSKTVTLSPNSKGGRALVNLPSTGSVVSIAAISDLPLFNFSIDNISFNTVLPAPVTQTASVVEAFGNAFKTIFEEKGAENLHATQQQLLDCASDITCNNLDELQQSFQKQNLKLIEDVDNAASNSINFVLSPTFDPFNPVEVGTALITGQLKDIFVSIIEAFKLLGDPPPTVLDVYGTGRHIALSGLVYNVYDLEVTILADLADLQFLHVGDKLFIDMPVFDNSLQSFGYATIEDVSLINGTARFNLKQIEIQSVSEPAGIFIFIVPMFFLLIIKYAPAKLDTMSRLTKMKPLLYPCLASHENPHIMDAHAAKARVVCMAASRA